MRKDCSVGQRSGGNIEDVDGGAGPAAGGGNAPNGESRDSSSEQPRKGGTQQWASPRGGGHRTGECAQGCRSNITEYIFLISRASWLPSRNLGSAVAVALEEIYSSYPLVDWVQLWPFIYPRVLYLWQSYDVCLPDRPILRSVCLSLSVLFHHRHPGCVTL